MKKRGKPSKKYQPTPTQEAILKVPYSVIEAIRNRPNPPLLTIEEIRDLLTERTVH